MLQPAGEVELSQPLLGPENTGAREAAKVAGRAQPT